MSEPIDDKTFDEYLSRQSQVSKQYRALAADEVPAELDRRVLAQAQAAVAGKSAKAHKRPAWMRWSAPLALAASAVLVVSIVIQSGTQHEVTSRDIARMKPAAPIAATAPQDAKSEAGTSERSDADKVLADQVATAVAEPQRESEPAAREKRAQAIVPEQPVIIADLQQPVQLARQVAAPPFVPAPAPAPSAAATESAKAEAVLESMVVTAQRRTESAQDVPIGIMSAETSVPAGRAKGEERPRRGESADLSEIIVTGSYVMRNPAAGQGSGPRGTVAPAAPRYDDESDVQTEQREREANAGLWLDYIRELRSEGKQRQANREWRRFVKAYPQFKVDEQDAARPPR